MAEALTFAGHVSKAKKPTLLFYCEHARRPSDLARSWAVAGALTSGFRVIFVNGGEPLDGMAPSPDIDVVTLPPVSRASAGGGVRRRSGWLVPIAQASRARLLLDTFFLSEPAVVFVEQFPFGSATFTHEILPMLEYAAAARRRPLLVCSVPDPIAIGDRNRLYNNRAKQIADDYFDVVLVHTDPRLATLEDTFNPRTPLRVPVAYTGLVMSGRSLGRPTPHRSGIVVSAGDGRTGAALFRAAIDAHALCPPAERLPMRIVTGPLLPDHQDAALRLRAKEYPDVTFDRSVGALRPLLASAALSISQCGYDTTIDLLEARVPALVVPCTESHEDEQRTRAARLEALGAVRVVDPDILTGPRLAIEILAASTFSPAPVDLDLDGAHETARVVARLWEGDRLPRMASAS